MIYGVAIISKGGIPIVLKEIFPGFFTNLGLVRREVDEEITERGSLVSSLITAIVNFSGEIFGSEVGSITIGDLDLFIATSKKFIVAIFCESGYREGKNVAEKILNVIDNINIDAELIELFPEKRAEVLEIIEENVLGKAPSLEKFKKYLVFLKNEKTDFREVRIAPEEFKENNYNLERFIFQKPRGDKSYSIDSILESFSRDNFWEVLIKSLYIRGGFSELVARGITILSGCFLRSMHPKIPAVKLDDLLKISNQIENDLFRELFKLHIKIWDDPRCLREVLDKTAVVMDKLEKVIRDPNVLALMNTLSLLKLRYGFIPSRVEEKFLRSRNLRMLDKIFYKISNYFSPREIDLLEFYNNFIEAYNKVYEFDLSKLEDFIELLYTCTNIPKVSELDESLKLEILRKISSKILEFLDQNILDDLDLSNNVKGYLYYPITTILTYMLEYKDFFLEDFKKYFGRLHRALKYFLGIYEVGRDSIINLQIYLSSIIAIYTTLSILIGLYPRTIIDFIDKLMDVKIEGIWYVNRAIYLEIYTNYLISIGNLAIGIKNESLRKLILGDVIKELYYIWEKYSKDYPVFKSKIGIYLRYFYDVGKISIGDIGKI